MAASIAEAFAVAAKSGLDLDKLFEVVSAGGVNSGIFQMMVGRMLQGDLGGLKFAIANGRKDLRYYTHLAEALPVPSFMGEAAHQSFVQAVEPRPRRQVDRLAVRGPGADQRRSASFRANRETDMSESDSTRTDPTGAPRAASCSRRRRWRSPAPGSTAWRRSTGRGSTTTPGRRAAQKKPLVIGLTMDASAASTPPRGAEERLGAMMAIKEFNDKGGVLGRQIEAIHMDTETTPATGSRIAERMITRNEAAFLIGAVHSGVANAISQVAQKYGCVYLNTNSSSPTEAGKDCHRVKFVWDGNGTNFSHAIVKNAMKVSGKNWVLLTNDYVWGHTTSKATRALDRGQRRQDRRRAAGAAEHARLRRLPAEDPADQARRGGHRGRRRRHQGAAPAGGAAEDEQAARPGSTTSRTGPTSTASGRTRSSACSAPTGTSGSTCRA